MTDRNVCPTDVRRGFTLVELMMTLVIIAFLVTIGWGVLYKVIDPASKESAQNQISGALNSARNRAMAIQKTCGILFFIDPRSNRVNIANVIDTGPQENDQSFNDVVVKNLNGLAPEVYLDLADTEVIPLPSGVTVQVLNNAVLVNNVPQNDQFIGFNRFMGPSNTVSIQIGGAVLFDARGELVCRRWAMRFKYDTTGSKDLTQAAVSPMLQLLFYDKSPDDPFFKTTNLFWCDGLRVFFPVASGGRPAEVLPRSTMGVAILDREKFRSAVAKYLNSATIGRVVQDGSDSTNPIGDAVDGDAQFRQGQSSMDPGERNKEQWIAANARVMMVGRYNGTLIDTRFTP